MTVVAMRYRIEQLSVRYPIYLALSCFYLPLSYYDVYSAFYDPYSIVPAVGILLSLALLLFALFRILVRDTQLAGFTALVVMMLLLPKMALAAPIYLAFGIAGIGVIVFHILKRKGSVREATHLPHAFVHVVNAISAITLIAIGVQMPINRYQVASNADEITAKAYAEAKIQPGSGPQVSLPHIIHIVLDGYSRADVLRETYGFDNSSFLDALRQRGFRVSDKATTPFNQTLLTMSSVFSLGPVTEFMTSPVTEVDQSTLRRVLAQSQKHGVVTRVLHDRGYELVSTPTTYPPMQWDRIVDKDGKMSRYIQFRLPMTYYLIYKVFRSSPILGSLAQQLFGDTADLVAVNFKNMKDLPDRRFRSTNERPLFVFEHVLAPHPPFNIASDGKLRSVGGALPLDDGSRFIRGKEKRRILYRDGYIEKLRYTNRAILEQIDALRETIAGPMIIILHGDHGGGLHYDQDNKANTCPNERFSPLLAVYATDPAISSEFTGDFNLVNIYRVIFRRILGIELPNLPNRSTYVSWEVDQLVELEPGELRASCTAGRKLSSKPATVSDLVALP